MLGHFTEFIIKHKFNTYDLDVRGLALLKSTPGGGEAIVYHCSSIYTVCKSQQATSSKLGGLNCLQLSALLCSNKFTQHTPPLTQQ